ncbi:MAG: phosphonate metabolism transcriptional regulator PhnF [Pseudomonadales bacterium]|jgi:phosphonate metabolism transcriptional regulator PhnF|nr:phosphonate metabolism transcriptional regulator PhnF [Pseudomonadales bacterium]
MTTARQDPLWLDVTRRIQRMIHDAALVPGDRLPTETDLAARFGVNRHTVRRALKHLEEQGNIEARQGRGRFLRLPAIQYQIGARPRFSNILSDQDLEPGTELLGIGVERAPEALARTLSLRTGSRVVHVERLGLASGNPISMSSHYLPLGRFPKFIEYYERHHSITRTLAACGLDDYVRKSTRVTSRLPTAHEREVLGVPKHVPLIVTRSCNVDTRGWPIEYGEARMASDRIELEIATPLG